MLNTDVDALGDDADTNALVANDSNGVLGDVEDSAGLTVVELVGHTSLDGTVGDDVNVVTLLVVHEVLAKWRNTVLSECFAEEISSASSKTETVGHLSFKPSKYLMISIPNYQSLIANTTPPVFSSIKSPIFNPNQSNQIPNIYAVYFSIKHSLSIHPSIHPSKPNHGVLGFWGFGIL